MTRRTPAQWKALIQEQQSSGLTQAQFCKGHNLCPRYFSLRKRQLATVAKATTAFVKVQSVAAPNHSPALTLRAGAVELIFHQPVAPDYLLSLIKSLS